MKATALTCLLLLFCLPNAMAQLGDNLLNDSLLHEIWLEIDLSQNWKDTLYNDYSLANLDPENVPEVYRRARNVIIDGVALDFDIGIKMRGNSTVGFNRALQKTKFPYKLAFDEFAENTFDGLKKINLNANTDNPSFLNEILSYKLLRDAGQPAPRAAFAKFFVNGTYEGVYLLVENADKTFLKQNYGSLGNDGNLYRSITSSLEWHGSDKTAYKKEFLLKTNEEADDWSRYITFVDVVNNTPSTEMKAKLEAIFDVENYLKVVAIERLICSWDSYSWGGTNFNLYERNDEKIVWIPWDYNETFQFADAIFPMSYLVPKPELPLLKAIFEQAEWREKYLQIVCEMLESGTFSVATLSPYIHYWHSLIAEAYYLENDPIFSYQAFKNSLFESTTANFTFPNTGFRSELIKFNGLFPFLRTRIKWADEQIELQGFDCSFSPIPDQILDMSAYPNPAPPFGQVTLKTLAEEQLLFSKVCIYNSMGSIVSISNWQPDLEAGVRNIPLDGLPLGFYIITKQTTDGRFYRTKLVVR